jgi:hypothetical protein
MTHMLSKATIEALWRDNDVPVNGFDEIDDDFCGWGRLTDRDEIWHWFDEQYARWGGVHALMFPDEHPEARDGLDPREYVVGTFEPCDVEWRAEPKVLAYVREHGLMDSVVMGTVKRMRDWYDEVYGDAASEFVRYALRDAVGDEKLEELER